MGRKILLITTDQQRYDSLGCNGGTVARTPVVDGLAADGIRYERAVPQSVVCMPSRSTIVTGQHPTTHGVWMNGVALPVETPTVAHLLHDAGYRTALVGKPHFEPFLGGPSFAENAMAPAGSTGPHRGFEHFESATHAAYGTTHFATWVQRNHPDDAPGFYPVLDGRLEVNAASHGDTGAPQVGHNPVPRERYHTDWVADRTISWLESLAADDDWFCWMSFPDPHHPWDPPASEVAARGIDWRDLDLPAGYPSDRAEREGILDGKPRHWRLWYDGQLFSNYEAPRDWAPATLTPDQVREVNAMVHVKNELVDDAVGRVLLAVDARGWTADTDVFFTTDHGELQGDFGLLFKGPYHVDALMRLPLVWRPARAARAPEVVRTPVGLVDLAPTFCAIAGIDVPEWMEGTALPTSQAEADGRRRTGVLTEWESENDEARIHLRTITRDGWVCTVCEPGTHHDGTEGELYDLTEDPGQVHNLWSDPTHRAVRDDLVTDLRAAWPATRTERLPCVAPV